ncbi:MAG: 23S rRNA (uracil(1939)-C(5))-methyltransferase RlmD [Candidatus Woesearchaeota archaeon]
MASRHRRRNKKKSFFDTYDYSLFSEVTPRCPHFGDCGGCRFQHLSFDNQLKLKADYLRSLFGRDVKVHPNPLPYGYRTRMDFVYAHGKLGLRKRGDFSTVIDIDECHLVPEKVRSVFAKVKSLLHELDIPSYDFLAHDGFLRYVIFRHAPGTGQVMVAFTTAETADDDLLARFRELREKTLELVTSVYWLVNDTMTDTSIVEDSTREVLGREYIEDDLDGLSLRISPYSFYQSNTAVTKNVFSRIREHSSGNVVDLCCGVGAIGLFVASKARSVVGLEVVDDAVRLARVNASLNGIGNSLFFTGDMKTLPDIAPLEIDTLIIDPPRSGLTKKVIKMILALAPDRIVYMSCNPKTQKLDLDMLAGENQYGVTSLEGYDMFTHTPHVETLLVLDHLP